MFFIQPRDCKADIILLTGHPGIVAGVCNGVVQSDLRTAVSRAVLSVPGHFFFAVAMGLLLSRAKQAEKQGNGRRRTVLCALAVLVPVVLHGVWDLCLAVRRPWATAAFYCFVVAFFIAADLGLRRASQTDAHL